VCVHRVDAAVDGVVEDDFVVVAVDDDDHVHDLLVNQSLDEYVNDYDSYS
jgi:hypothetical protein